MSRDADLYVVATRSRFERPRNTKRWYRCRCGRWWGVNKSTLCHCNAAPPGYMTPEQQRASDIKQAKILDSLGHPEWAALVRSFL